MTEEFDGEIRVASTIIDYLSSGLYKSPAACLKELVNNSYDADATEVEIFVKPDADRIIIADDGHGMNREEFVAHFRRISTSVKRSTRETTSRLKRPKIGKIGIGFIAANEICELIEIYSTKEGSEDLLHVCIDFEELKKPQEQRIRNDDVVKADYTGEVTQTAKKEEHYTRLFLSRVKGAAKEILASAKSSADLDSEDDSLSLYGLTADSINVALLEWDFKTWQDFDAYSETMLHVALNVPVRYHTKWIPNQGKLEEYLEDIEKLRFKVTYDGVDLRKPIVFPGRGKTFLRKFAIDGEHVSAKGYFYAQHGIIKPIELQGVLVRIRHAAVGEFDPTFLNFSQSEASLIQKWVACEVWVDDRLEEAMNIDRSTLRDTHPAYVEFKRLFHSELRKTLSKARSDIYQAGSQAKRTTKAKETVSELQHLVDANFDGGARKIMTRKVQSLRVAEKADESELLKKYTVVQFFSLVIEAAKTCLPKKYQEAFLQELFNRLRKKSK